MNEKGEKERVGDGERGREIEIRRKNMKNTKWIKGEQKRK
jgi:hypothetical protein